MLDSAEYCRRCGSILYDFSKKRSASDGYCYCIKCAEYLDKKYLIDNTCSVCARTLGKADVKFVMPSRLYSTEQLPLEKRLVCVSCYKRIAFRSIVKSRVRSLHLGFRHSIASNFSRNVARIRN